MIIQLVALGGVVRAACGDCGCHLKPKAPDYLYASHPFVDAFAAKLFLTQPVECPHAGKIFRNPCVIELEEVTEFENHH